MWTSTRQDRLASQRLRIRRMLLPKATMEQRVVLFLALCYVERLHVPRHVAHTAEVVGPLGDADSATCVEHVEQVRTF